MLKIFILCFAIDILLINITVLRKKEERITWTITLNYITKMLEDVDIFTIMPAGRCAACSTPIACVITICNPKYA